MRIRGEQCHEKESKKQESDHKTKNKTLHITPFFFLFTNPVHVKQLKSYVACCASSSLYTGIMFLTGCHWLYSCFYRKKLRGHFFLEDSPCGDCCVHCCCEPCALCQEHRELRLRGLDPSFGMTCLKFLLRTSFIILITFDIFLCVSH